MLNALAGRAGTATRERCFFCLLRCQNSRLIVGRRFPLLKGHSIHRASRQTLAQTIAVVLPQELRLATYDANGTFVSGIRAEAAAVEFFFIDGNNSSDHGHSSIRSFLL